MRQKTGTDHELILDTPHKFGLVLEEEGEKRGEGKMIRSSETGTVSAIRPSVYKYSTAAAVVPSV